MVTRLTRCWLLVGLLTAGCGSSPEGAPPAAFGDGDVRKALYWEIDGQRIFRGWAHDDPSIAYNDRIVDEVDGIGLAVRRWGDGSYLRIGAHDVVDDLPVVVGNIPIGPGTSYETAWTPLEAAYAAMGYVDADCTSAVYSPNVSPLPRLISAEDGVWWLGEQVSVAGDLYARQPDGSCQVWRAASPGEPWFAAERAYAPRVLVTPVGEGRITTWWAARADGRLIHPLYVGNFESHPADASFGARCFIQALAGDAGYRCVPEVYANVGNLRLVYTDPECTDGMLRAQQSLELGMIVQPGGSDPQNELPVPAIYRVGEERTVSNYYLAQTSTCEELPAINPAYHYYAFTRVTANELVEAVPKGG